MIDGIIKGDGTSRTIKATLPATYSELVAQAAAGTLQADVLFNALGWDQEPTFLNKATLLSDATANAFGLSDEATDSEDDATVNNALIRTDGAGYAQYLTFVANVNQNAVDAALGKGNEDRIRCLGQALALYAWWNGETGDFANLQTCQSIADILGNTAAMVEALGSTSISTLLSSSDYARPAVFESVGYVNAAKSNKSVMDNLIATPSVVDSIRTTEDLRAAFNRNRIRILNPGTVEWTVPEDWPTDFVHYQLVGGGGNGTNDVATYTAKCGQYVQGTLNVSPGDVLTAVIGGIGGGSVSLNGITAVAGGGAEQTGSFLVKATNSSRSGLVAQGGFEGGTGASGGASASATAGGVGDGTLGLCDGTGGSGNRHGSNGGGGAPSGGGACGGGGGYGGAGGTSTSDSYAAGKGGSGAIVITCPPGYIPEFVLYNHEGWIRDENIFNDFGEETA